MPYAEMFSQLLCAAFIKKIEKELERDMRKLQ